MSIPTVLAPSPNVAERNPHTGYAGGRTNSPRFLFLPVSGPFGMGEYARSLAIAHAVAQRWPHGLVHFALSREAPYATQTPFPFTLLPSSPTFHTREVVALINDLRPQVVIFDNSGRTAQLRAAHRVGARVVYVSARQRQRRKAFRLRWLSHIDEHWFAYPKFLSGALTATERFKLRLLGRPIVRYLDAMVPPADPVSAKALLDSLGLRTASYVLLVPGGGTGHPGVADAVNVFSIAAHELGARGIPAVLVASDQDRELPHPDNVQTLPRLPLAELTSLMRHARVVIANGGSTMLQAIVCNAPCVAVAIAKDQARRIQLCAAAGIAVASPLHASQLAAIACTLAQDDTARNSLIQRAAAVGLADGPSVAVDALQGLISRRPLA
jgi:ADP-heptose:LPS heptosyltransferase